MGRTAFDGMKKKKVIRLIAKYARPGPIGPQGVAGVDLTEKVRALEARIVALEKIIQKQSPETIILREM